MWGPTGITRLFNAEFGNMMSWLLPGALVMGAVLLVVTLRARRTDRERAGLLLWGGSLVSIGLVISLAQGIIHPYYTVALAPPLGALVGIGTMGLWQRRATWVGRLGLAAGLAATVVWSYILLGRTSDWFPALRPFVAVVGALGVVADPGAPALAQGAEARHRRGGDARPRRGAGRTALLDRGHGRHAAQRSHPVGDADRVRRLRRPRRLCRGGAGGFPGAGARRAFGGAGGFPGGARGGGFPGGAQGGGFPGAGGGFPPAGGRRGRISRRSPGLRRRRVRSSWWPRWRRRWCAGS